MKDPALKFLHSSHTLNPVKLAQFDKLDTDTLITSLLVDRAGCLKARPDGTVLDGHHRLQILKNRGVDVDALPRSVLAKEE